MKKNYFLSFILLASLSFGQAFTATYDFASLTSVTGLIDPTPVPTVAGLTFGSFSAVNPTTINSAAAGRFAIADQPLGATNAVDTYETLTGSINLGVYFQVVITPIAGTSLDLSQITFRAQRSGTGIRTYAVRSSIDSYAANLPASIAPANSEISVQTDNIFFRNFDANSTGQNGSTITLGGASYTGITTPITLRFYGWNAEASGGNFSIDDVKISGSTTTLSVKQNEIADLNVYPNPVTKGTLYVTSNNASPKSVSIFDILGKQVLNTKTSNNAVNVANLKGGVYIVKITDEGKTDTKKLIIQ